MGQGILCTGVLLRLIVLLRRRNAYGASIPAARVDLEGAAKTFAHDGILLREQCRLRWGLHASACESRWQLWLRMQARESSRQRQLLTDSMAKPYQDIRLPDTTVINELPYAHSASSIFARMNISQLQPSSPPAALNSITLAIGVVSACTHYLHRRAMRNTWLSFTSQEVIEYMFFLGIPSDGILPGHLVAEISQENDITLMNFTDTYGSTVYKALAIFQWGVDRRAHYILRCNDDVYLRLRPTLDRLFAAGPPARIYAGIFLDHMQVPRLDDRFESTDPEALRALKAWTLDRNQYPANAYPLFAQGNAYILSRDLALAITDRRYLWPQLPDDVMTGLHVDALTAGHFRRIDIPTDYELEGRWAKCSDTALWHFNIHYEHMYDLHLAEPTTRARSLDLEIDGNMPVQIHFDVDRDNITALAFAFVRDHQLANLDASAVQLRDALHQAATADHSERRVGPCDFIFSSSSNKAEDERVFCCG